MNFNVIITDEGRALLTTIINNNYLLFIDQPRMSENNYVGQEAGLTEATFDGVFVYGTASKSIIDATTLRLKISFTNISLVADHDLYTIGVIARAVDPDTHQRVGSDALLAVCTTNTPTPIPAYDSYYSQWAYNVNLSVGSTQNMTVVATQAGVQYVDLTTPLAINGNTKNTVEEALDGLNNYGDALADNLAAIEKGGAQNLNVYPYADTTKTENGITWTDIGDGTVKATGGTGGTYARFELHSASERMYLPNGTYKISGCPTGAGATTYSMFLSYTKDGSPIGIACGESEIEFTIDGSDGDLTGASVRMGLDIESNVTLPTGGIVFKPMIRDARIIDDTWVPYAETNLQLTRKTSGLSNENLLDNPFFTVNQRGQTNYSSNDYTVDRWRNGVSTAIESNTVVKTNNGVTVNNGANLLVSLYQKIENISNLFGKKLTLSVILDNTLYSNTFVYDTNDPISLPLTSNANLVFLGVDERVQIECIGVNTVTNIRAVKLELGSVSTLANDVEPNYTTELLKCQRYFVAVNAPSDGLIGFGNPNSATTIFAGIPLSTPMRTNPSVSSTGTANVIQGGTANAITNVTFSVLSSNYVQVVFTSSGMTVGAIGSIKAAGGGYSLYLSADL